MYSSQNEKGRKYIWMSIFILKIYRMNINYCILLLNKEFLTTDEERLLPVFCLSIYSHVRNNFRFFPNLIHLLSPPNLNKFQKRQIKKQMCTPPPPPKLK